MGNRHGAMLKIRMRILEAVLERVLAEKTRRPCPLRL
jgi:hypothetical protein